MAEGFLPVLALLSLAGALAASTRPHYGGTLRVEMRAAVASLDPAEVLADPAQAAAKEKLAGLVFERLVQIDEHGRPQPQLAVAWQADAEKKRWEFRLRSGVKFHDGSALTPADIVSALEDLGEGMRVAAVGEAIVIQAESPRLGLLFELTQIRRSIIRRGADGVLLGTGPFRVAEWEPGRRALLAAFEAHWGGRPFLDAIEIQMGRTPREQLIDLQLGKADVSELTPEQVRSAAQGGIRVWSSAPVELLALVFDRTRPATEDVRIREAMALSIDRAAIHNVLLQRQGEIAGGLLPQWLSGYAFLFPTARDLERSRQLWSRLASPPKSLVLAYDASDSLARSVAERIAVNAREAGIAVQANPHGATYAAGSADARLVRLRIKPLEAATALANLVAALDLADVAQPSGTDSPEQLFAAERVLVESYRVVPLAHLPEVYGLSAQVKNWLALRWGAWRLEDVWVAPPSAPVKEVEKP